VWFIGGYGPQLDGVGTGIGLAHERADGSLEFFGVAATTASPSYLIEGDSHVYSADEASGTVSSFRREGSSLVHDGTAPSGGELPCHLTLLDGALVVSNYLSGTVGVVELSASGAVDSLRQVLPSPIEGGHAHASLALDSSTLVTADLGDDSVLVHTVSRTTLTRTGRLAIGAGTGPRDLARHASGSVLVLGQLDGSLSVLEEVDGVLGVAASIVMPGGEAGDAAAAIAFGPGGHVYAGLRGSDRISVARTDGHRLEPVGWVSCEGHFPRHLTVDGTVLHVANQRSGTVTSFRLGDDGLPALIREPEPVPSPTFLMRAR
jgi:6-phosphogluconolactonase